MSEEQSQAVIGTVTEALPNATFRVTLDAGLPGNGTGGKQVLGHLAGRLRKFRIRVLVGDRVRLELSPYGDMKGRIVQRL